MKRVMSLMNRLTQYDAVDVAKHAVSRADQNLLSRREALVVAREQFEKIGSKRDGHQQEMHNLLHRKPNWTSRELAEFTDLCQVEHDINVAFSDARKELLQCEQLAERALTSYLNSLRSHYNEELLWSEKGRRLSNYYTSALILFNSILFGLSITLFEPRKRQAVAERVAGDITTIFQDETKRLESNLVHTLNRRYPQGADDDDSQSNESKLSEQDALDPVVPLLGCFLQVDAAENVLSWVPLVALSALVTFSALSK